MTDMTPTEREVGRIGGMLQGVAESMEDTTAQMRTISAEVTQLRIDTANQNIQLGLVDTKITAMQAQVDDLMALKSRLGGMVLVISFLGACLLSYTGIPALISKIWARI